ncbi:MAG: 3-phosphoshikimate 1-carboxyvinyltransferase [Alphaproteobacteria bacterium]|nr:3-phosphoshikimate 1-carboxyvinyltransferase [Alphaproteobacteria bacterium]
MAKLRASPSGPLKGTVRVPGDKSISHRSLILGALAAGRTIVSGILEGDDVLSTAGALRALGAHIERTKDGRWVVDGLGLGAMREPGSVLDLGNSGTGARLTMGVVATQPFTSFFTGDASLCKRPMARVTDPLKRMGAQILARSGTRLPLAITGSEEATPIEYTLPVPSAQVKSAILLAGLGTAGETTVIEPEPTRDHTERMLRRFGATVHVSDEKADGKMQRRVTVVGEPELRPAPVQVPGDPSSAAFLAVAALILPGSEVRIENVGMNPLRTGVFESLREMGADIRFENERKDGDEEIADLVVRASALRAISVPAERAPRMIDEYPIFAVAAALAHGTTRMEGLAELKVKESDRLSAIANGLRACGATVAEDGDALTVEGLGGPLPGGANIDAALDHRIAMVFLVAGLAARSAVTVDGTETIATSFPGFASLMEGLGASITPMNR